MHKETNLTGLLMFPYSKVIEKPIRDTTGRPIGEGKCAAAVRKTFRIQYARCPIEDGRRQRPLKSNQTALRRVEKNWTKLAAQIQAWRAAYRTVTHAPNRFSFHQSWRFVEGLKQLILFQRYRQLRRRGNAAYHPSELEADLYKVVLGLNLVFRNLTYSATEAGILKPESRLNARTVFAFAESQGMLSGREEACPASRRRILETLELVMNGRDGRDGQNSKDRGSTRLLPRSVISISQTLAAELLRFSSIDNFLRLINYLCVHRCLMDLEAQGRLRLQLHQQLAGRVGLDLTDSHWKSQIKAFQRNAIRKASPVIALPGVPAQHTYALLAPLKIGGKVRTRHMLEAHLQNVLLWLEESYLGYQSAKKHRAQQLARQMLDAWGVREWI